MKELPLILKGCLEGDHRYQKILYDRYYGFALKTVFRYIYKYENAVDVVNEGYIKLFRAFKTFHCDDKDNIGKVLMGWIKRIMINTAIDELRRKKLVIEESGIPDYVWEQADNTHRPDQILLYKELVSRLRQLPPSYRTVFNMHIIDGFSHQEIADILGISVGTSKSHLLKARQHLKKNIEIDNEQRESINRRKYKLIAVRHKSMQLKTFDTGCYKEYSNSIVR